MTLAPRSSLAPNPHTDQTEIAGLEVAKHEEFPDVRLPAAERQFVTQLLERLDERLSVEALMFLAGGAEHKAQCKRAGEGYR
jgi:hypothetical protein